MTEEFGISSLLYRAGWSPSGLISFVKPRKQRYLNYTGEGNSNTNRTKQIPSSLAEMLDCNHSVALDVPGEASFRIGGEIMDNFETAHASLAPPGARTDFQEHEEQLLLQSKLATTTSGAFEPPSASASASVSVSGMTVSNSTASSASASAATSCSGLSTPSSTVPSPHSVTSTTSNNNNNNQLAPQQSNNSFSSSSPQSKQQQKKLGPGFDPDFLRTSRCRISVENVSQQLQHEQLQQQQYDSNDSNKRNELGDNDMLVFRTQLWETERKSRVIARYAVTRTWRQIKLVANFLRELNPELLIPAFELLDLMNEDSFIQSQRHEFRLELLRGFVSTVQRNSTSCVKSPVVIMFLFEEDLEAFGKFLTETQLLLVTQSEARSAAILARRNAMIAEYEQEMNPNASSAAQPKAEPGFFAKLFGSSSSSSSSSGSSSSNSNPFYSNLSRDQMNERLRARQSPETVRRQDEIRATARLIFKDIADEMKQWDLAHKSYSECDQASQKMLSSLKGQSDALRDFMDSLVEHTDEIVGTSCPFPSSSTSSAPPSEAPSPLVSPAQQQQTGKGAGEGEGEDESPSLSATGANFKEAMNAFVGSSHNPPAIYQTSSSSPPRIIHEEGEGEEGGGMGFRTESSVIQAEAKDLLRLAVMLGNVKSDALMGAEHMVQALCLTSRLSMLHARSAAAFLRHHSVLCERCQDLAADSVDDSEALLEYLIHIVRPVSVEELTASRSDLGTRFHTASVLFLSLSRQLCDSSEFRRVSEKLKQGQQHQQTQRKQQETTSSASVSASNSRRGSVQTTTTTATSAATSAASS